MEEDQGVLAIEVRALLESIAVSMVSGRVRKLTWTLPFMTGGIRCFKSPSHKGSTQMIRVIDWAMTKALFASAMSQGKFFDMMQYNYFRVMAALATV